MSWRPRLIATDLDGTLFGADAWISARTIRALRSVHAAGIEVVAVTGRSHHTAVERLAEAGVIRHAVCSNGGTRYDLVEGRLVACHPMDPDHVAAIVTLVGDGVPGVGFGVETTTGFAYDERFLDHLPVLRDRGHRPALVPPARDGRVIKVMAGHPRIANVELLARLDGLVPPEVSASTSGAPFVEITAAGVDKAFGLAAVCGELGVAPIEVLAFGDHLNDLPMLAWAGRSVAVANAHPAVLAAATDGTGHHARDGVATYLEALLSHPLTAPRGR